MVDALTPAQTITAAIAILALVVSVVSLVRTSKTQRQQRLLQRRQEMGLRPSMNLYLDEAYIHRAGAGAPRIYVFRIMASNGSDLANSISDARLVIEHQHGQGPASDLRVSHNADLFERVPDLAGEALRIPCPIPARTSVAGLLLFEVASALLRESSVESYTLQVVDTFGEATSVEARLLIERGP
jgi:hypothetical protein